MLCEYHIDMTREEIIGYNFRRLREKAGLSPKQAAELGDTTVTNIYQLQGSKKHPELKIAFGKDIQEKWARIFNCSVAEFFRAPGDVQVQYPDDLKYLLDLVIYVMQSDDRGTQFALIQNIEMFAEKVRERAEHKELKERIESLERATDELSAKNDTGNKGSPDRGSQSSSG